MSQPSPNSPSETNPTQETGQPQPSAKSHNASKIAKRSLIGLSLVAIVVLLVVGVCNWLPPQMAKWELEEQGVMTDGYGQALLAACEKNDVKTVALLMTAGADVNKADKDGETPLHCASRIDHTETVRLLIAAGADVNKANKRGETPLHAATGKLNTEIVIVKLLIAAGADVNKANKRGEPPLYRASHLGHTEAVKLLVAAGADVNKAEKDGETPLQWASSVGLTEIVELLKAAGAKE